jgi:hypothetical protein
MLNEIYSFGIVGFFGVDFLKMKDDLEISSSN